MAEAAQHVRRVLAADFAAVLALSPEGRELRVVASQWSTAPLPPEAIATLLAQPTALPATRP